MQNELGIDKSSFRKKIVRQMQARMLGIGSTPSPPQQFLHRLESCKAVSLSWEKSSAREWAVPLSTELTWHLVQLIILHIRGLQAYSPFILTGYSGVTSTCLVTRS